MTADLLRVLGLWRGRTGWLLAGVGITMLSALIGAALLALAGQAVAAVLGGAAVAGTVAFLLLRPLIGLRPAARWAERMVTHAATFRALADTRVWFFRRLAERLPAGIGLRRSGDLLGRMVADVEALDGLYLKVIIPVAAALAMVAVVAALLLGAPLLAAAVALPLAVALALPLLLAPGAARAATEAAEAQGACAPPPSTRCSGSRTRSPPMARPRPAPRWRGRRPASGKRSAGWLAAPPSPVPPAPC
ncbi:hypothetical protein ACFQY5_06545 [Paeniroseomonas aquatica]|uniref:hypothetical protein n=1 Tax=Paeniroseomonas aquatica TaxID=373043 RepID=UPI003619B090